MNEPIRPTVDLGYPTEAHGRIPAFQNIEEEAEFWDTHDFTDYLDDMGPAEVRASPHLTSEYRYIISLTREEYDELARQAAAQEATPSALLQRFVHEQLMCQSRPEAKAS